MRLTIHRRGFIAAIFAAPLALLGSFAGNHNLVAGRLAGPDAFAKFKGSTEITEMWTNIFPGKNWVLVKFGDGGTIISKEEWHGKSGLPWVSIGDHCG